MESIMRILLPVDDSTFSDAAVHELLAHVPPKETQVRVLHVLQPLSVTAPPQMAAMYAPELEGQAREARSLVERVAGILRGAGFRVDSEIEKGDIRLRIIDSAAEWNADLIVIGSHGRSGLPRLLLGSVADFVAHNAPCSVEIVRSHNGPSPKRPH
jgi:nucleotide-binding universal stress UspA family protein